MGQSKGGGYQKLDTLQPNQQSLLDQMIKQYGGFSNQAAQGFQQFLPGGGGGKPIADAAQKNYLQSTVPSLLNKLGSNSKGSSSLNQALGASASDLNTNLASMLSQLQLQASNGLGNLGQFAGQQGLQTPGFAYTPKPQSRWQSGLQGGIQGAGAGAALGPWGAAGGGIAGLLAGLL